MSTRTISPHSARPRTAIIGAGIMGLCTGYELQNRGHTITIYDPAALPASNASSLAGGMLAPYSEIEHMPDHWISAGLSGINSWAEIARALPTTTPIDFAQSGSLFIAHEADRYMLERFITHVQPYPECEIVNAKNINTLEPNIAGRFAKGLYMKNEAHLHPRKTIFALLKSLNAAHIQESIENPQDLTNQYDYVIDCRGFGAEHTDKTLRGVQGETVLVQNRDFTLNRPVRLMHPRYPLYIVPRQEDNLFLIGATNIESADTDNTRPGVRSALELLSALYSLHPSFGDARIIEIMAGIRPAYPDNLPRITQQGNVLHCNGLFRHGFLLAPVMAQCAADMIEGKPNTFANLFAKGTSHEASH